MTSDDVTDLLARKDRLTDLLRDVVLARAAAREEAGLSPEPSDDTDTEEQTLLRVGLHQVDVALEKAGYFG